MTGLCAKATSINANTLKMRIANVARNWTARLFNPLLLQD